VATRDYLPSTDLEVGNKNLVIVPVPIPFALAIILTATLPTITFCLLGLVNYI